MKQDCLLIFLKQNKLDEIIRFRLNHANMEKKKLHKRIKLVSLFAILLFTIGSIAAKFYSDNDLEFIISSWIVAMIFPLTTLLTSYLLVAKEKPWLLRAAKYTTFFYPLCIIAALAILFLIDNTLVQIILITFCVTITVLAVMHIFIFSNPANLTGTIIFIVLITTCIFLKRYHVPFGGIAFSVVLMLFSLGSYMFGVRCLYLSDKNKYFSYTSFIGSCLITITFMGLLWKMQHWPLGSFLVNTSYIITAAGTLIVLLTLASSGFLDWPILQKKVLRRLLLPWIMIFLFFIIRFLLPDVNKVIWTKDLRVINNGFGMYDYNIDSGDNAKSK